MVWPYTPLYVLLNYLCITMSTITNHTCLYAIDTYIVYTPIKFHGCKLLWFSWHLHMFQMNSWVFHHSAIGNLVINYVCIYNSCNLIWLQCVRTCEFWVTHEIYKILVYLLQFKLYSMYMIFYQERHIAPSWYILIFKNKVL